MVSIFLVKAKDGEKDALKPINRGLTYASAMTLVGAAVVSFGYIGNEEGTGPDSITLPGTRLFFAIFAGVVFNPLCFIKLYFSSYHVTGFCIVDLERK